MADPGTMGIVSIASNVAGGVLGAMGASQSASAQAQAYQYKAGIALLNQKIAKDNAAWAINAGGIKAANYGTRAGQEIAQTKVAQSASGTDVNFGSNAAVRETQQNSAKFDQDMIRADAAHTAYGYEVEAAKDYAEAKLMSSAADDSIKAGKINMLSSLINAGGSVASKWTQGQSQGMFSGNSGPIGTFDPDNWGAAPTWA